MTHRENAHVIGVRLPGSSNVHFFTSRTPGIASGSWVLVPTDRGEVPAQVVVAPDQLKVFHGEEALRQAIRVMSDEEIDQIDDVHLISASGVHPAQSRLIGGTGFHDPARHGVSHEDEKYRQAKQSLPRLGLRFITAQGAATVVSLDVPREMVTIRYDETGDQETFPVAEFLAKNANQEE